MEVPIAGFDMFAVSKGFVAEMTGSSSFRRQEQKRGRVRGVVSSLVVRQGGIVIFLDRVFMLGG